MRQVPRPDLTGKLIQLLLIQDNRAAPLAGATRVLVMVCDGAAIAELLFVIVTRLFYARLHMSRQFEFDRVAIIGVAIGLLLLARTAARLAPRALLAGTAVLGSAGIGLAVAMALSLDVSDAVKQLVLTFAVRKHLPAIYLPDERYAYVLRPNSRDRHRDADFDVTYTIDAEGHRVTPSPLNPRTTLLVAGDSFTFGDGVEDHETYTSVLGREYWRDIKVVNAGVSGWGITQGYLTIADALERSPLPSAIVYQMIPDDQFRSYLRTPIVVGVKRRLEFVDGRFELRDVSAGRAPDITPALIERELAMNRDVLERMNDACREHHVPFAILLLQDAGRYPPDLIYALASRQIPVVDLTRLRYERFTHDYHPNAADHRRIAEAVAISAIRGLVYGRATHD